MKGGALLMALGKPAKAKKAEASEGATSAASEAKADLATALDEWQSAATPEAKADAFLAALDLAEECRGYASDDDMEEEEV